MPTRKPTEDAGTARRGSGLNLRVVLYLRHEAQLETVRRQRHSLQAREIVAAAVGRAEVEKASAADLDPSFAELRRLHQNIVERL